MEDVGAQTRILHSDWLGNSRLSTLYLNRTLAYDAAYTPYGETYVPAGSQSDVDFTGMRPDTQTGLYDFSAREYSTVGRWISPDPSGLNAVDITNPQSWNRYAYVNNYPPTFTDPTGLCAQGAICPPSNPCAGPIPGQGGCNTSGNFPCLICGLASWDGLNINWNWSSQEDSFYGVMIVVIPGTGPASNAFDKLTNLLNQLKNCPQAAGMAKSLSQMQNSGNLILTNLGAGDGSTSLTGTISIDSTYGITAHNLAHEYFHTIQMDTFMSAGQTVAGASLFPSAGSFLGVAAWVGARDYNALASIFSGTPGFGPLDVQAEAFGQQISSQCHID